ncbi:MAG: hypothetical protein RL745_861 [Actinomycetota bacterium]|jgi:RimJ/RimL family protein N-acetyltransferase
MTDIQLLPLTAADAADIYNGRRQQVWAPDFPTDGDVVIAGLICRRIAAGVDYEPATADRPWATYLVCVDSLIVGGAGFKGAPDADGLVEIGYGIAESHQGRGIATAAVRAIASLAHQHGANVTAETEEWNTASIKVLQKAGFTQWLRPDETHLWWRLDAPHGLSDDRT